MHDDALMEMYRREVDPAAYREIRELYKAHSVAEDARDIEGLIAPLSPDCVYELVQSGDRWEGHEGAAAFYTQLLTAFPDVDFQLTDIVIGPQGVFEVARVTATHQGEWLGVPPTGEPVAFGVLIYFPWDPSTKRFSGERIWVDSGDPRQVPTG